MKTLARTLILIATCLSLNVAAPVSAETEAPKADAVEIGCALRLERNADGSITETCL